MTTYAISLLTNRHFVINLSKPCQLENIFEPNVIDWKLKTIPDYNDLSKHYLNIDNFNFVKNSFMGINFINYYFYTDVIVVTTGLNLIQHLSINIKHHERLKQLGFEINKFNLESQFNNWYKKVFKLNKIYQNQFQNMLKIAKPNVQSHLICAQIRIGANGDLEFTNRNNTKFYWNFIRDKFLSDVNKSKNYKLFITTDVEDVIDEAIKEFGVDRVVAFRNRSIHLELARSTDCKKFSGVFLDFNLLGECDEGIISHSGFGFFGILNRQNINEIRKKFYVYTNPDDLIKNFGKRNNLSFIPFESDLLYLENKLNDIKY